jgi:hypothetical protein
MTTHPAYNPHAGRYTPEPLGAVIEPTRGPWKNNIHWGNTVKGVLPASSGVEIPIFDGSEIVGPPRAQTVHLFRDDNRLGANADYRAHIYYGVGSLSNEFFCDWSQGSQITLVANWVRVNAQTYTPLAFAPYNPTAGIVSIGAGIVEGTVAKGRAITFTEPTEIVANGALSSDFDAPDFARAVMVHVRSDTPIKPATAINVDVLTENIAGAFLDRIDASMTYPDGFIFPGNAKSALAFNHSGVAQMVTLQWILGL